MQIPLSSTQGENLQKILWLPFWLIFLYISPVDIRTLSFSGSSFRKPKSHKSPSRTFPWAPKESRVKSKVSHRCLSILQKLAAQSSTRRANMKTFGSAMRNSLFPKAISHLYLHRTGRDEWSFQDPSLTYATQHSNTPACAKCIKIQRARRWQRR